MYFGLRVHRAVAHVSEIAGLLRVTQEQLRENTFGVKIASSVYNSIRGL